MAHSHMEIAKAIVLNAQYAAEDRPAPGWVEDILTEGESALTEHEGLQIAKAIDAGLVRL